MNPLRKILSGLLGLLAIGVIVILPGSCGSGTSSGGLGGGGDSGGGDTGLRPAGLPPAAENPTLKLVISKTVNIDGILDVQITLTDLATDVAAPDIDGTVCVTRESVDNVVDCKTCTTDANGECAVTVTGVKDQDTVFAAAVGSNTVQETINLTGIAATLAGTPPEFSNEFDIAKVLLSKANSVDTIFNAQTSTFEAPYGIEIDAAGEYLYVAESSNCKVRKIKISDGTTTTLVGTPSGEEHVCGDKDGGGTDSGSDRALIGYLRDLAIDANYIYIADFTNNKIRRTSLATGITEVLVGPQSTGNTISPSEEDPNGTAGCVDSPGYDARFIQPFGIDIDPAGEYLYVADTHGGNRIRKVKIDDDVTKRTVTTLAGPPCGTNPSGFVDGAASAARFSTPGSLSVDEENQYLYVSDIVNNAIRRVTLATGEVTTVVGAPAGTTITAGDAVGDTGSDVRLSNPFGTVIDPTNKILYILDLENNKIKRSYVDDNFRTEILAGPAAGDATAGCNDTGFDAAGVADASSDEHFTSPASLVVAPGGATLYVTDSECSTIRTIK